MSLTRFLTSACPSVRTTEKLRSHLRLQSSTEVAQFFSTSTIEAALWGKNLFTELAEIYRDRLRFFIPIVSEHYESSDYTRRELSAAQDRAMKERREYILVVRVDDAECSGILSSEGYLDLREQTVEEVCDLLVRKLEDLKRSEK